MRLNPTDANEAHRSSTSAMNVGIRMWHETREPDVRVRQRVVDRRRDDGANLRRDPPRDFLRNQDVGQERPMRAVLLGRARRDDHGVVALEKGFDLESRHLAEEDGRRFHRGRDYTVVHVPIPSSVQTSTSEL